MAVTENEIVFFRYRNRLMAGVCLSSRGGKVRFATARKETVNTPVENVLLRTGESAGDWTAAARWMARAEEESEVINLEDAWELVRDDADVWTVDALADLYFGGGVTPDQRAALLVHLEHNCYFEAERRGGGYRALSDEEVHDRQAAAGRQAARAEERARFRQWFEENREEPPEYVCRWVDRLKDYVFVRRQEYSSWLGGTHGGRQGGRAHRLQSTCAPRRLGSG